MDRERMQTLNKQTEVRYEPQTLAEEGDSATNEVTCCLKLNLKAILCDAIVDANAQ